MLNLGQYDPTNNSIDDIIRSIQGLPKKEDTPWIDIKNPSGVSRELLDLLGIDPSLFSTPDDLANYLRG